MKCPHCLVEFHPASARTILNGTEHEASNLTWFVDMIVCPACNQGMVLLGTGERWQEGIVRAKSNLVYPAGFQRAIDPVIPSPYANDFKEAAAVLNLSPKASAALSRRCLQALLVNEAQAKGKDLNDQIEDVIASKTLPSRIADLLHFVRTTGNFAAHPKKSTNTGQIIEVEAGEAELNLNVLESLFDFYFVAPAKDKERMDEWDKKMAEARKPLLP